MVKVAKTPLGFFAFSVDGKLVERKELPTDPRKAAAVLMGNAFEQWVEELKNRGYSIDGELPLKDVLKLLGISVLDYREKAREILIELAKIKIKEAVGRDQLVVQVISALDDLNKTINILFNRFREWYGIYYPERVPKELEEIKDVKWDREPNSMGIDLEEVDLRELKRFYQEILSLLNLRDSLEKYIETVMPQIAPNLSALATPKVGARLLERAGSLRNLAFMPGSTIQVLGAEKALFKHLQRGSPPPKHGVLLQHPTIMKAPKKLRGKLARALASKIAIAARLDLSGRGLDKRLVGEWERRKREIFEKVKEDDRKK